MKNELYQLTVDTCTILGSVLQYRDVGERVSVCGVWGVCGCVRGVCGVCGSVFTYG